MKKLMITAAAVAMTAGAYALPSVYDYKASIKNMYLKEVKIGSGDYKGTVVYQKYQKSTTLKGYLIMDDDGVTSPTIMADRLLQGEERYITASTGFDYGRSRGFLVVQNPSAYSKVRFPKILPAVLDAKWVDTAFTKGHTSTSGLAEGTLYVGGDAVQCTRPQLDVLSDNAVHQRADVPNVPLKETTDEAVVVTPGMVAAADYVWTSVYLFAGSTEKEAFFNGPNWFKASKIYSPFGHFEYLWDQNLPELLRTGWKATTGDEDVFIGASKAPINYYHDTWMNGAGFGKWSRGKEDGQYCCGIFDEVVWDYPRLESLSGNLKGGIFLCTENGIDAKSGDYNWFDAPIETGWEDQFNTARLQFYETVLFSTDSWQNDLWQDGFVEQETTDVAYGTWSIKRNTKFFAEKNPIYRELTVDQIRTILASTGCADLPDTIWGAINGAAYKLNTKVNLFDGTEIYKKDVKDRADLPMVTPQFAKYYRLVYDSEPIVD